MKLKTRSSKRGMITRAIWGLGVSLSLPALAEEASSKSGIEEIAEITVTARRIEERLQDVPVAMSVFKQDQLDDANITNITDLTRYTPSLGANTRWGTDSASFTIRGFAQEQRTTASVATYFSEVVAPRGGATLNGGDGAGPGAFFDLQNVQVLNGPQGTLFGRNTTGGAVILVPNRPTDELDGYVEVTGGDFDLRRAQGVLNLPFGDKVKLRLGVDSHRRDGYLKNQSPVGPSEFNNIDYDSYRASLLVDITPNIENYTIGTYMDSKTHGTLSRILACTNNPFFFPGPGTAQVNASTACSHAALPGVIPSDGSATFGQEGFYDVWNSVEDARFENEIWQVQNTTSWQATDHLKVKNLISYGELTQYNRADVNGTYLTVSGVPGTPFATTGLGEAYKTADQSTFSEELQFVGDGLDGRLNWQAGLYYEKSNPLRLTGSLSQTLWKCTNSPGSDPLNWTGCTGAGSARATLNEGSITYDNKAVYAQGDYEFDDALTLTLGIRYTWDHTSGIGRQFRWTGNNLDGIPTDIDVKECSPSVTPLGVTLAQNCELHQRSKTDAPTWTVGLNYKLTPENMLYAKYSRGYRQGSVNPFGPVLSGGAVNLQGFDDEKVDAYEIGSKNSFDGAISGIFNVALFYNDLTDAQLQAGFIPPGASPTIAILNADRVTTYGAEVSGALALFEGLTVNYAYSYLHTNVDDAPVLPPGSSATTVYFDGQDLFNTPENKLTVGATYRLPFLPSSVGEVSVGATWSYIDTQLISVVSNDGFNHLPSYDVMHANLNWNGVFGSPFDISVFVTNATDEQYNIYQGGVSTFLNFESVTPAPPRMYGVRLRYSFGGG